MADKKDKAVVKESKESGEEYDFIIIGAGVAGLSAAMYAARLGLKTLCLGACCGTELPIGGVVTTTKTIENYPGFMSISGVELAEKIKKQAESYPLVAIRAEKVEDIEKNGRKFAVKTSKRNYWAKTILFATGAKWRKLEVPGSTEFENRGVAYCALCDAPLYKNKAVAVVGGANSAARDALILAEYAKKVYILYRGERLKAEQANIDKIMKSKNIEVVYKVNISEIKGGKKVKAVLLDREFNGKKELELDGVFVAIGHIPNTELAKKLGVALNDKGEIILNHKTSETSVEGVYAAGDVVDKPFKQAMTGVAEGCTAAYAAFERIQKNTIED